MKVTNRGIKQLTSTGTPTCVDKSESDQMCEGGTCYRAMHATFSSLTGPFADGQAVTSACLDCHDDAANHLMTSAQTEECNRSSRCTLQLSVLGAHDWMTPEVVVVTMLSGTTGKASISEFPGDAVIETRV